MSPPSCLINFMQGTSVSPSPKYIMLLKEILFSSSGTDSFILTESAYAEDSLVYLEKELCLVRINLTAAAGHTASPLSL